MPAFHSSEKQFRCSHGELWQYVKDSIEEFGWDVESESSDEFEVSVGFNPRSFGELIKIELRPRSILRVTSRCKLPIQILDFGKNHANIMRLFGRISDETHHKSES